MPSDWIDRADDYEIHAYLFFEFRCSDCNASAPIESEFEQASEAWCRDVSLQARVAGWVMPPDKDQNGDLDQRCFCPRCVRVGDFLGVLRGLLLIKN